MSIVAGIGGNSGNQTMTLIIRALALGQINNANIRRLVTKELATSREMTVNDRFFALREMTRPVKRQASRGLLRTHLVRTTANHSSFSVRAACTL